MGRTVHTSRPKTAGIFSAIYFQLLIKRNKQPTTTDQMSRREAGLRAVGVCSLLLVCACCANPHSPVTSTQSRVVSLSAKDDRRTVWLTVPTRLIITLSYDPSGHRVWQLASGGAGFKELGTPIFHPDSGRNGTEVLSFVLTETRRMTVVLDYAKVGPISSEERTFEVTLRSQRQT